MQHLTYIQQELNNECMPKQCLARIQHSKSCYMSIHNMQMPDFTFKALKDRLCQTEELLLQFAIEMSLQSVHEYNAAIYTSHNMAVCSLQQYSILAEFCDSALYSRPLNYIIMYAYNIDYWFGITYTIGMLIRR